MAAPSINVMINDATIRLFWKMDTTGTYYRYNLYWSLDSGMAGEALVAENVPNQVDKYYSKDDIVYTFKRSDIGVGQDTPFYVRIKGENKAGVEDVANPSATKLIIGVSEKLSENNFAQIVGYDYDSSVWRKVKVDSTGALS